jgi:uncharacterized protein (TIGR02246 family)
MSLFDAYLMVDWSSNSMPKKGVDSIWLGWWSRQSPDSFDTANPSTRAAAKGLVLDRLLQWKESGQRVLVGFDFGYAYPRGTAAALKLEGDKPWRCLWELLSSLIQDKANNRNNRFEVASELNALLGANLFWGCPQAKETAHLQPRKSATVEMMPPRFRLTEEAFRRQGMGVQEAWKLFTTGSVGSQMLTGIPVVQQLRDHRDLAAISKVWPLETGFTSAPVPESGPFILHAEIWPGILDALDESGASCRDEAQVRELCRLFRDLDATDCLRELFERPTGLTDEQVRICEGEEGWTLGSRLGIPIRISPVRISAEKQIQSLFAAWADAVRRLDAGAVASLVTEDAEFWSQGAAPLVGQAMVETTMTSFFERFELDQQFEMQELVVSGDLAFVRGLEHNRLVARTGGEPQEVLQRAFSVIRRESDGHWRFARGMTNQPLAQG